MTTEKCLKCGCELSENDQFCPNCGATALSRGGAALVRVKPVTPDDDDDVITIPPIVIRIVAILTAIIALIIILNVNLLFPWQICNRENRDGMIAYLDKYYPGAKIVKRNYRQSAFAPPPTDSFEVEYDGVRFKIFARSGKISWDSYSENQRFSDIEDLIYYGFCIPHSGNYNMAAEDMRPDVTCNAPNGAFYDYDGVLELDIYINQHTGSKRDIEWLYSFDRYMKINFPSIVGCKKYSAKITVFSAEGWDQYEITNIPWSERIK